MKYMLIINHGSTPTPPSEEWDQLAAEEKRRSPRATARSSETAGVTSGRQLSPPETATTVRVEDGKTLTTDGPFVETKEAIGGYLMFEADDLDSAIGRARSRPPSRRAIPAARLGDERGRSSVHPARRCECEP